MMSKAVKNSIPKQDTTVHLPYIISSWRDSDLNGRLHILVRMPSGVDLIHDLTITDGNLQFIIKWPDIMTDVNRMFSQTNFSAQVYNSPDNPVVKTLKISVNNLVGNKSSIESVVKIPLPTPGSFEFTPDETSGHESHAAIIRQHPDIAILSSYIHFFDLMEISQEIKTKQFTERKKAVEDFTLG